MQIVTPKVTVPYNGDPLSLFWYKNEILKIILTKLSNQAFFKSFNSWDLEKQEGCGMVAHERLTEPRVTM